MNIFKKIKPVKVALFTVATVIIFLVIFRLFVNLDDFVAVIREARIGYILLTALGGFLSVVLAALRWYLLLKITNYGIAFKRAFSIVMATWTLSIFPGRLGDFARSYPLRKRIPPAVSVGTVAFEKIIDVSSLFAISAIGFLYIGIATAALIFPIGVLGMILILYAVNKLSNSRYMPKKLAKKVRHALLVIRMAKKHPSLFFGSALVSFINWCVSVLMLYALLLAFGAHVSILTLAAYFPIAIFLGLIPISIAGMGTRDSALIIFLSPFAQSTSILAAGIGYSFFGYFLFSLLGIPFLIREMRNS